MWIVWIVIGIAIGWLIPQPQLQWADEPVKVGLLKWVWLWTRDKFGMN